MRTYAHVLTVLVLAATTVGPVSAATVPVAPVTTIAQAGATSTTVSGTVADDTGAPISGATVTLRGPKTYSGNTDATGNFSLASVDPGLYTVEIARAGYDTARDSVAVAAGTPQILSARLHIATLTSLHTIATVRAVGRGTFNTSTAAVNTVTAATFAQQAQPQVTRVINEIPGVQISLPNSSANGAVPGAITFPNIRGALSYETATLIDGHPLSVGTYGDYVTTFLNSYMLGQAEVVKGPGATVPEVNYAIGGTINFRTKDPTATLTPEYTFGFSNHGGTYFNLGLSDTIMNGRLGFVVDVAGQDEPSALNNYQASFDPTRSSAVVNNNVLVSYLNPNNNVPFGSTPGTAPAPGVNAYAPGTISLVPTNFAGTACCYTMHGNYNNLSELVKLRYNLSGATTATFTYFGGQVNADQNANTSYQYAGVFSPGPGFTGSGAFGPLTVTKLNAASDDLEINNEPILQGEIRTTLGNDTIVGRYYHAGINRLISEGSPNPNIPTTVNETLNGTFCQQFAASSKTVPLYLANGTCNPAIATVVNYSNANVPVTFYDSYHQNEIDQLSGYSFIWDHPVKDNDISFALDQTNSQTTSWSQTPNNTFGGVLNPNATPFISLNLPSGSAERYTTLMLRGRYNITPKLTGTLSLYDNLYQQTVATNIASGNVGTLPCNYDGTGCKFTTSSTSHFDNRLALEFRPRSDLAVRFAAGSAIAPPYLLLVSGANGSIRYSPGGAVATQNLNAVNLAPETAYGYNLGADLRLKDNVTFLSGDVYMENLFNHFLNQTYNSGLTCTTGPCPAAGVPLYYSQWINVANSRFQGLELQIKHVPQTGFGYNAGIAFTRAYAYNLPPNFYCTTGVAPNCLTGNLGITPNNNFVGSPIGTALTGLGYGAFQNQNIPYLNGNVEGSYRWKNGASAVLGDTFYGKNNSLNVPPFGIAYASVSYPLTNLLTVHISGDNIFNAYNSLFPLYGRGIAVPLANGYAGATQLNTLGPATYRFELTKTFGAFSQGTTQNQ